MRETHIEPLPPELKQWLGVLKLAHGKWRMILLTHKKAVLGLIYLNVQVAIS